MPTFKFTQDWVGYIQRSSKQMFSSIVSKLPIKVPELTDHTDSNILIILISIFTGIGEHLNGYIDRMARESFISSAKRYKSLVNLAKLVDYRVKAAVPATSTVLVELLNSSDDSPHIVALAIPIPPGTIFSTPNSIPFYSDSLQYIQPGTNKVLIPCTQASEVTSSNLGTTLGIASEKIALPEGYVHGSIKNLVVGSTSYQYVESLALSISTDKVFYVEVDENKVANIVFGDGINGAIVISGSAVIADYKLTYGSGGLVVPLGINIAPNTISPLPLGTYIKVYNPDYASGGKDYEDIEDIRNNAPRSLRTLHRAVTALDYEDLAMLVAGVGDARVKFCCSKCITVYIAPSSVGIATPTLLQSVSNYFNQPSKTILGRCTKVAPAGMTRIWVDITISPDYGVSIIQANNSASLALANSYDYDKSYINRNIYLSDIIACIDNTPGLNHLAINSIWAEPYARPINNTTTPLLWSRSLSIGSITTIHWKIKITSVTTYEVYKSGILVGIGTIGTLWVDGNNILSFTINPFVYTIGDTWEFTTYPVNTDIIIDDLTIPYIEVNLLNSPYSGFYSLSINPPVNSLTCNTTC